MKLDAIFHYSMSYYFNGILLSYPPAMKGLVQQFEKENQSSQVRAIISKPYRERSTGKHSQSNHIWGHIQQIANFTGDSVKEVEDYVKIEAISANYPYHVCRLTGRIEPDSMTTITTEQASILIETIHRISEEHGIQLYEGE